MAYLAWVQNIFVKARVFAWHEAPYICSAWRNHAFPKGFRGMVPREFFKKMVQFGAFWRIFCKNFVKKNIHFYIKLTDNVLLRTLCLGLLDHTPQISGRLCNLVCFGAHFP